ncbi:9834_t:CDS:1, partial [Funneliformis mosseae]
HVNADSHGNAINIITPDVAFGAGVDLHCKLNAADSVMTWESHPHSYPKIVDIPTNFQVEEIECFVRR